MQSYKYAPITKHSTSYYVACVPLIVGGHTCGPQVGMITFVIFFCPFRFSLLYSR